MRRLPAQSIRRCGLNATFRTRLQQCDGDWWPLSPRCYRVAHAARLGTDTEICDTVRLVRTIKAHIAKGDQAKDRAEQHYISAGQHLKTLQRLHKDRGGTWAKWEALVKEQCGIAKSRASELMQIADGRKTVKQVRERANESSGKSHAKAREISSPLISGETADTSAEERKARYAADDMPTEEEADESHQSTLYDHACLIVDEEMSGETRRKFFAHIKEKYDDDERESLPPEIVIENVKVYTLADNERFAPGGKLD